MDRSDVDQETLYHMNLAKNELQRELTARGNMKGTCLPNPPKRGEIMYCQHCGKPMLPQDFSKNPIIRKKEFKWQIHYSCQQVMMDMCDRNTKGLSAERKQR